MPIGQLNVNNQEDLISRGAINEGEPDIQRHGGFTVRFPAVPRCAPQGSITILMAVHLLGRSLYGDNWTGEELAARYRPEPTDQELATRAFAIATDEAIAAAAAELDFRTEAEVFRELRHKRDMEFAPRRRWQSVAERLIHLLYHG